MSQNNLNMDFYTKHSKDIKITYINFLIKDLIKMSTTYNHTHDIFFEKRAPLCTMYIV